MFSDVVLKSVFRKQHIQLPKFMNCCAQLQIAIGEGS